MIPGAVLPSLEPMVQVIAYSSSGEAIPMNVLVDTRFTGSFSLPQTVAARLGLTSIGSDSVQSAMDGCIPLIYVRSISIGTVSGGQSTRTRLEQTS